MQHFTFSVFLLTTLAISSCSNMPARYGSNTKAKYEADNAALRAKNANLVADELSDLRSNVSKQKVRTTGTLLRGASSTVLDFSRSDVTFKIGDKIYLEEGVYTKLPSVSSPGVVFIGKGQDKTFIKSADKSSYAINDTGFWDLTIVDSNFTSSGEGIWLAFSKLAGTFNMASPKPMQMPIGSVLSDLYTSDILIQRENFFSHFLSLAKYGANYGIGIFGFKEKFPSGDGFRFLRSFKSKKFDWAGHRGYIELQPTVATELNKSWDLVMLSIDEHYYDVEEHVGVYKREMGSVAEMSLTKKLANRMLYYLQATKKAQVFQPNPQAAAVTKQKAISNQRRGNAIAAGLLWDKYLRESGFSDVLEVEYEAKNLRAAYKNFDLNCHMIEDPMTNVVYSTKPALKKIYPSLTFEESQNCVIHFSKDQGGVIGGAATSKVTNVENVMALTKDAQVRQQNAQMAQAAAAKAQEKARLARFESQIASMKSTANNMYEGRVRAESWGNQKMLVYGSGNWSPGQSAESKVADAQAREATNLANKASVQGTSDYEKVGERKTYETKSSSTNSFRYRMLAAGGKYRKQVDGNWVFISTQSKCVEKDILPGGAIYGRSADCTYTSTQFNLEAYVAASFFPEIKNLLKVVNAPKISTAKAKISSASTEDKLEGEALLHFLAGENKESQIQSLTEKLVGRKLSSTQLRANGMF